MRILSHIISVLFHPLLVLTYAMVMLTIANPYLFKVVSIDKAIATQLPFYLQTFLLTVGIPLFGVLMMRGLNMISGIEMQDKQERIGPFILVGLCYTWYFYNIYKTSVMPPLFQAFTLGVVLALWVAFVVNLFQKISLHAVGMGGMLAISILCVGIAQEPYRWVLVAAFIVAGLVGSARLYLKAHTTQEVWGGYLVGFFAQFVAMMILL